MMMKFCVEVVGLRCRQVSSTVIRPKASNLGLRLTYLLTEWFIELHFAAKNGGYKT